jgi:SAM-dependent methyltransferase
MVALERWETAQKYERGFWEDQAKKLAVGESHDMRWYQCRADQLAAWLRKLGFRKLADGEARALEVGCGPVGLLAYYRAAERVAVDPLDASYARNPVFAKERSAGVVYREGRGESLPVATAHYDLVVIDKCIDRVKDVEAVMRELRRATTADGVLYLTVSCRTPVGYYVHRMLSRLRLDRGHPHTFTGRRVISFVRKHGFEIIDMRVDSYGKAFREDLRGPGLRPRLKALLGVSEFCASVVARKQR